MVTVALFLIRGFWCLIGDNISHLWSRRPLVDNKHTFDDKCVWYQEYNLIANMSGRNGKSRNILTLKFSSFKVLIVFRLSFISHMYAYCIWISPPISMYFRGSLDFFGCRGSFDCFIRESDEWLLIPIGDIFHVVCLSLRKMFNRPEAAISDDMSDMVDSSLSYIHHNRQIFADLLQGWMYIAEWIVMN